MRVVFSQAAFGDLESIGDYIAKDSPSQAARFTARLVAACNELGQKPLRFARYGNSPEQLRRRVFGRYLIFYVVAADRVAIARILNAAMDVDAILSGEED